MEEKKSCASFSQGKHGFDECNYNYNLWMRSTWPCAEATRPALPPGGCLEESSPHRKEHQVQGGHLPPSTLSCGTPLPWTLQPLHLRALSWNQGLSTPPALHFAGPAPTGAAHKQCPAPRLVTRKLFTHPMATPSLPSCHPEGDNIPH